MTSVHIHDDHNLGDQVCNPCDYFEQLAALPRHNAWSIEWPQDDHLLIGGGGMLHGTLEAWLALRAPEGKLRIAWGLGHNRHDTQERDYSSLAVFDLVGCRDYGTHPFHYVPCASCLHPAFNEPRPAAHLPYVIYEHHQHPIELPCHARLTNDQPKHAFAAVLDHLCLGQKVITNTFHGAYWAMLLGKPVVLWEPFSTRFGAFKHQPLSCLRSDWRRAWQLATAPPVGYLTECRQLNFQFMDRVARLCGERGVPLA